MFATAVFAWVVCHHKAWNGRRYESRSFEKEKDPGLVYQMGNGLLYIPPPTGPSESSELSPVSLVCRDPSVSRLSDMFLARFSCPSAMCGEYNHRA